MAVFEEHDLNRVIEVRRSRARQCTAKRLLHQDGNRACGPCSVLPVLGRWWVPIADWDYILCSIQSTRGLSSSKSHRLGTSWEETSTFACDEMKFLPDWVLSLSLYSNEASTQYGFCMISSFLSMALETSSRVLSSLMIISHSHFIARDSEKPGRREPLRRVLFRSLLTS